MFQLRYATEPAAASIAAQYSTPEDHTAIGEAFDAMQTAGKDLEKWIEADLRFHKAIYLATHNEFFWSIGQLFNIVLKEMFKITASGAHRPRALAEHRALMEAIFAGTSEAARELSLKMVSNATDDVLSIRRSASPKLQREPT
jgi:DNA-binding FadR family transcriptional regulator